MRKYKENISEANQLGIIIMILQNLEYFSIK